MKFVHAADIHLDSPLQGLERYEGAPVEQIRGATRRAVENLVDMCILEGADLLVIAGDLYDGNWKDYNTGLFFAAQMSKLRAADIPVVLIRGNHDAASQITRSLRLPDNVTELSTRRAETKVLGDLGVAVHGQGFANKAVTDDLAARYPDRIPGLFNVGLLHTCVDGREGHESYAPCKREALLQKGYEYWALGHVHKREVLHEEPWVVFPGNLQGRHARETGPKGATVVTVENGRVVSAAHRSLDAVRWTACEVNIGPAASGHDVVDLARMRLQKSLEEADGRAVAARVIIEGSSRAHAELCQNPERWGNEVRAAAMEVGGEGVWVEKIRIRTRTPIDLEELRDRDDALGQLVRSIQAIKTDQDELSWFIERLSDLRHKLPPELREAEDGLRLDDPAELSGLLDEVEQMLIPRLLQKGQER
ncbi:MAG TPA: DNA repair exonuclease [Polyangiaceae bacterium]|nr:DNA repair exonuclease [Polyangiaceae bacterium]